jgi:purine-binding chemotaxis protein CheW
MGNNQNQSLSLVMFDVGEQRYALRLHAVERVLPMVAASPLPKAPDVALGVINLAGAVVPVVDIRRRFGLPPREYGVRAHLLLARTARWRLALPVDEVLGVREVPPDVVTAPEAVLPRTDYVAGIVALPDGLLFIHDLEAFLSLDEERRLRQSLEQLGE